MMAETEQTTSHLGRKIMSPDRRHQWRSTLLAAAATFLLTASANAETRTVRIATQYGISYLPLTIMAEKKLLEAEGKS
jgi:ABC-type nitrate/sulfonate/bicarbonate transport system substrate-binding protein